MINRIHLQFLCVICTKFTNEGIMGISRLPIVRMLYLQNYSVDFHET